MRKITAELLARVDAHCAQLDEFQARFPDGLDPATVRPDEVVGLDVEWAVQALLPAPAMEAYWEAAATAWDAYWEVMITAWEAHKGAEPTTQEAHEEAVAQALEAYLKAEARAAIDVFREYWQEEG